MESIYIIYKMYPYILFGLTLYKKYEEIKYYYEWINFFDIPRKLFLPSKRRNSKDKEDDIKTETKDDTKGPLYDLEGQEYTIKEENHFDFIFIEDSEKVQKTSKQWYIINKIS